MDSSKIKPHAFQVHDGDDAANPETWCMYCNCTRVEGNAAGLHVEWGVDEDSGEYFVENSNGERIAEGLTFAEALALTEGV